MPKLVAVSIDSIRVGEPLPFALMDAEGTLLAGKGYVIATRSELQGLVGRGVSLYIDVADSEAHHRAYVGRLHEMVLKDTTLGEIAGTQITGTELASARGDADVEDEIPDWLDYQVQANSRVTHADFTHDPAFLRLRSNFFNCAQRIDACF